jgi:Mg-chelatase subunit ChlD
VPLTFEAGKFLNRRSCLLLLLLLPGDLFGLDLAVRGVEIVDWPSVRMIVRATDGAGRPISGIRAEHLVARIGDLEARIDDVRPLQGSADGLDIVLVIDASGTMRGTPIEDARRAAVDLLVGAMADDRFGVLTFNDDVTIVADLDEDRDATEAAISGLVTGGNQSVLYKTVIEAIRLLRENGRRGRSAIVVVSDGHDESLGVYTLEDCIREARESDIPVFGLGLVQDAGEKRYLDVLLKMSERTGGRFTQVTSTGDLSGLYREIYTQLRQLYMIQLSAADVLLGGRQYGVEINVTHEGRVGRAMATLVAPPPPPVPETEFEEQPESSWLRWAIPMGLAITLVLLLGIWRYRRRGSPGKESGTASPTNGKTSTAATIRPVPTSVANTLVSENSAATAAKADAVEPATAPPSRKRGETVVVQTRPQVWAHLIGAAGPHADAELALWGEAVTVGSRPGNDIVLQDDAVSGQHAIIARDNSIVVLTDRDSTNGSFVNSQRVSKLELADGDRIQLGSFEYVFRLREM